MKMNFKIAKNLLAPFDMTIRAAGGEYRVNFKGGDEVHKVIDPHMDEEKIAGPGHRVGRGHRVGTRRGDC